MTSKQELQHSKGLKRRSFFMGKTLAERIKELAEQLEQKAEEIRQRIKGVDVNGDSRINQTKSEQN